MRHYYAGQDDRRLGRARQGRRPTIAGGDWHPYSPADLRHAAVPRLRLAATARSAARGAKMLELFTGSDRFGAVERPQAGELTEAEFPRAADAGRDGVPADGIADGRGDPAGAADLHRHGRDGRLSRMMGGYHIQADNEEGSGSAAKWPSYSWPKFQAYFDGTAPPPRD